MKLTFYVMSGVTTKSHGLLFVIIVITSVLLFQVASFSGINWIPNNAFADTLPPGSSLITSNDYGIYTLFNSIFQSSGAQTINFPDTDSPTEWVSVNVTTGVSGAVFYFTIDGTEYNIVVPPNTNYRLVFDSPKMLIAW